VAPSSPWTRRRRAGWAGRGAAGGALRRLLWRDRGSGGPGVRARWDRPARVLLKPWPWRETHFQHRPAAQSSDIATTEGGDPSPSRGIARTSPDPGDQVRPECDAALSQVYLQPEDVRPLQGGCAHLGHGGPHRVLLRDVSAAQAAGGACWRGRGRRAGGRGQHAAVGCAACGHGSCAAREAIPQPLRPRWAGGRRRGAGQGGGSQGGLRGRPG
jgi:hypothetical protein